MSTYCGREFSAEDIQTIRQLMQHDPSLQRPVDALPEPAVREHGAVPRLPAGKT